MEMMGAITGLIGAGLQAQAQHDQLMFQYAHFNWEKERADQQDWFAQAARKDQYGNKTAYNRATNEWDVTLAPTQKEIQDAQQKEQLLELTKDAPAARKVTQAIQQRSADAKEPFLKASLGYQYDQPPSEGAIRSDLTGLMAQNDQRVAKQNQALTMRAAARLGQGAKASDIINATDQSLGDSTNVQNRMLQARNDALKEFSARTALHEQQWGTPMKMWADLMSQGGNIPQLPKGTSATDSTGAQQQAMLQAFNQGTSRVGSAFDALAGAAGKSPDLSAVAKALGSIKAGKGGGSSTSDANGGLMDVTDGSGDYQSRLNLSGFGTAPYDPSRNEWGVAGNDADSLFG